MPKISVIVPVYKVEDYLCRCIDSILAQTFTDFELILVDDGSPDKCGVICDEYAAKDSRVHVIHQENAGVSVAYKLNSRADNINDVDGSSVWVYFPTRDETDLPFLIHGSFETAVSREKLMAPSSFNDDLFDELGDLIAESMLDLAERKLITQVFLRRSILGAFED